MGAQASSSRSRLLGWPVVLAGLIVVGALVWIWATDTAADLDPNSAEGVVQRYAAAVVDGDERAASQLLTERAQVCEDPHREPVSDMSISLISVDVTGDRADVRVAMTQTAQGGPFGPDEWRSEGVFELSHTAEGWRIERVPWELQVCAPSDSEGES